MGKNEALDAKFSQMATQMERSLNLVGGNRLADEVLDPAKLAQATEQAKRATVQIQNYRIGSPSTGSGFIVSDHEVLTNMHVVGNTRSLEVRTPSGELFQARVSKVDPVNDLAVLEVEGMQARPDQQVKLGTAAALKPGQVVFAASHPNGIEETKITLGKFALTDSYEAQMDQTASQSVRRGVSHFYQGNPLYEQGIDKYMAALRVTSSAAIDHGSSGGGLFNLQGEVVAVTTNIDDKMPGKSMSIPAEQVSRLLNSKGDDYQFVYEKTSNIEKDPHLYALKDLALPAAAALRPRWVMPAYGLASSVELYDNVRHLASGDTYGNRSQYWREAAIDTATIAGGVMSFLPKVRPVGYMIVGARIGLDVVRDFVADQPRLKKVFPAQGANLPRGGEPLLWSAYDQPVTPVRIPQIGGIMRGR